MAEPRRDLAVPLPARVETRDGVARCEYVVNLSPSGLGLHAREPIPLGDAVEIGLRLPGDGASAPDLELRARARVIWADQPPPGSRARFCELGLRFEALDPTDRGRLLVWLGAAAPAG